MKGTDVTLNKPHIEPKTDYDLFVPKVKISKANRKYIADRSKLVPLAEKFANFKVGANGPPGDWNLAFLGKMDELWNEFEQKKG
jgi:hypothetical protein